MGIWELERSYFSYLGDYCQNCYDSKVPVQNKKYLPCPPKPARTPLVGLRGPVCVDTTAGASASGWTSTTPSESVPFSKPQPPPQGGQKRRVAGWQAGKPSRMDLRFLLPSSPQPHVHGGAEARHRPLGWPAGCLAGWGCHTTSEKHRLGPTAYGTVTVSAIAPHNRRLCLEI